MRWYFAIGAASVLSLATAEPPRQYPPDVVPIAAMVELINAYKVDRAALLDVIEQEKEETAVAAKEAKKWKERNDCT